jgi:hypothetical protein
MTIKPDSLAAMSDDEIAALVDRLERVAADARADLAVLRAERKRRHVEPPAPPVDLLAELLGRPSYFIYVLPFGGYEKLAAPPKDRPSLAIVEIDRWQYTATYDDSRGRFVYPPAVFRGHTDWGVGGARDGSTFFRRDRKRRPPPPEIPLDYVAPGFISSKEWRRKMNIPDGTPT